MEQRGWGGGESDIKTTDLNSYPVILFTWSPRVSLTQAMVHVITDSHTSPSSIGTGVSFLQEKTSYIKIQNSIYYDPYGSVHIREERPSSSQPFMPLLADGLHNSRIIISAVHATAGRWPPQLTPCTSILSHPHPLTATNFLDVVSPSPFGSPSYSFSFSGCPF